MKENEKHNPFEGFFEKMRDYRNGKYIDELPPEDKTMFLDFLRYMLSDVEPKTLERWMSRERGSEVFISEGMAYALKNGRVPENARIYKEACASLSFSLSEHDTAKSVKNLIEKLSDKEE